MSEFIANTTYGQVKGSKKVSVLRTEYLNFLGIPYAAAPIGELRFKDPIEPQKWQNVYDATAEKSRCYGMDQISKQVVGSEDCLFLNIFTKLLNPSKPFPVLVYIHGGAFNSGSSTTELYSPDYLLMADVIVVTLNYRVGPLGFMSFKDANLNVPGNAGMKDQVLALKFIKNNIQNFGGDPENITLIGHSAGGGSVSWHCLSELSKGLFHKAIIMSGCALNSWALTTQYEWPLRIAKALGFKGDEENESVLKFLHEANPIEMVQVQKALVTPEIQGKVTFPFGPHIEPYMVHGETFIHVAPLEILKSSWANEIDILIGGTTDEGIMYLQAIKENPAILKFLKLENMVPSELNLSDDKRNQFVEILRQLYFPSSKPSEDKFGFCHMMTDKVFWHGMNRIVQGRQNYANGKTFLYRFAVDSPTQNHYKIARLEPNTPGVCHADELSYLFKDNLGDVPERETIEFKTIQRFVSVFTSFAISGNPNDNFINAQMQEVEWKAVDGCEPPFKCLNIEENLSFIELPEYERLEKWDQFYKSINAPLF